MEPIPEPPLAPLPRKVMNAIASSLINGLLRVKPVANFAKARARSMMIDRAESLGIYWRAELKALQQRQGSPASAKAASSPPHDLPQPQSLEIHPLWEQALEAIANPDLTYPDYYLTSFHAYEAGNLGWLPAMEVDVAARAVHARIWPEGDERAGIVGDDQLRLSYHQILLEHLPAAPQHIVDLGAGTGRSTFSLQKTFPHAQLSGVELSPYFLAVAQYLEQPSAQRINWHHAPAEATGLSADCADLVSACLIFHELPAIAAQKIIQEAYRLLKPGGYFAIMDMNPTCDVFSRMPPYLLTLLKSTEPYLDQYLSLEMTAAFQTAGFTAPKIVINSPRHRTIIGQKGSKMG